MNFGMPFKTNGNCILNFIGAVIRSLNYVINFHFDAAPPVADATSAMTLDS